MLVAPYSLLPKNTVPVGLIDNFARDDGWIGDRPAPTGNMWHADPEIGPGYLKSGQYVTCAPDGGGAQTDGAYSATYLGAGDHNVYIDVTNSLLAGGDQNYWVVQLCLDYENPSAGGNVQLEVSQRNSFVVWYYPGAVFPTIYASGIGMAYGVTERWYFNCVHSGGHVVFTVQKSALDGSGLTTVMSGNTGADNPTGPYMAIQARNYGNAFLQVVRQ
jgi:hypothetical protein